MMITVIIQCNSDIKPLSSTLSTLIEGVVFGVIKQVILWSDDQNDILENIATETGCLYLSCTTMQHALSKARGEWILFLEKGARPQNNWPECLAQYITTQKKPAKFQHSRAAKNNLYQKIFGAKNAFSQGLLIQHVHALKISKKIKTAEQMAKSIKSIKLSADIIPAD